MIRPRDFRWRLALCGAAITLAVAGCTSQAADGATTSGAPERTVTPSVAAPPSTALGSAAVTGSTASPSKSTPPSSPRSSPKPTGSTKPTPTSLDVAAREDADRAAIEAQWVRFWVIYDSIVRTPKESRPGELRKVAVQPLIKAILKAAVDADSKGIDNYGTWKHRVSWQFPVKGASTAVIADCQDQSKTGTYVVKSGQILTVGKERSNMRGEFLKGTDGVWRLRQIYVIGDQKC